MKSFENVWAIRFSVDAAKAYECLPRKDGEKITAALDALSGDPHSGDIKKLKGSESAWRRRVGAYRIIYTLIKDARIIFVVAIDRRTTTTY